MEAPTVYYLSHRLVVVTTGENCIIQYFERRNTDESSKHLLKRVKDKHICYNDKDLGKEYELINGTFTMEETFFVISEVQKKRHKLTLYENLKLIHENVNTRT